MHLVEISIFPLNNVTVRPTKIMNRADKNWAHFKKHFLLKVGLLVQYSSKKKKWEKFGQDSDRIFRVYVLKRCLGNDCKTDHICVLKTFQEVVNVKKFKYDSIKKLHHCASLAITLSSFQKQQQQFEK